MSFPTAARTASGWGRRGGPFLRAETAVFARWSVFPNLQFGNDKAIQIKKKKKDSGRELGTISRDVSEVFPDNED